MIWAAGASAQVPAFDHARHAPLKRPCTECHSGAVQRERAGFPAAEKCQVCHSDAGASAAALRQVAAWKKDDRPYPLKRIYVNRDFVIFSHARHAAAKIECAACHGNVYSMPALTVFKDTSMQSCVDCHTEYRATLECVLCHDLGQ